MRLACRWSNTTSTLVWVTSGTSVFGVNSLPRNRSERLHPNDARARSGNEDECSGIGPGRPTAPLDQL